MQGQQQEQPGTVLGKTPESPHSCNCWGTPHPFLEPYHLPTLLQDLPRAQTLLVISMQTHCFSIHLLSIFKPWDYFVQFLLDHIFCETNRTTARNTSCNRVTSLTDNKVLTSLVDMINIYPPWPLLPIIIGPECLSSKGVALSGCKQPPNAFQLPK